MADVFGAVKSRLRSRSRHRYSTSRSTSTHEVPPPPQNGFSNGHGNGTDLERYKSLRQEALAYEDQGNRPGSSDEKNVPFPMSSEIEAAVFGSNNPAALAQSLGQEHQPTLPSNPSSVPDRYSSLRRSDRPKTSNGTGKSHHRITSQPTSKPVASDIPTDRTTSLKTRKPRPLSTDVMAAAAAAGGDIQGSPRYYTQKPSTPPDEMQRGRVAGHRTANSIDLAPSDPSPLVPRFRDEDHEREAMQTTRRYTPDQLPPNLRLPPEFKLGQSERTHVETQWMPAVTQEKIHRKKTEVLYPAITRDIHVHHYYQYSQVILVQEVLPAKHYKIDKETGEKVEIPPPPGWEMPEDMQPRNPDTSLIRSATRHYLVDDDHPEGVLEDAPSEEVRQKFASRTGIPVA